MRRHVDHITDIPVLPGTYALVLRARVPVRVGVGRLGTLDAAPGWYVYVGSAFGAGGLAARVGRHLRRDKPLRWHIDYLRARLEIAELWWTTRDERLEHEWARILAGRRGASVPMPRFGASDCGCAAHLIRFNGRPAPPRGARRADGPFEPVPAKRDAAGTACTLRPLGIGDVGWIAHRQGILYAEEYGWDGSFEALVAEILARFVRDFDADWERAWIAERDGAVVGSVFVVRKSKRVAKLRLLYVEPSTRGLGIGRRLVDACLAFARAKGYRKITLWTQENLVAARRIYEAAGFRLVATAPHRSFGKDLIGETWEVDLGA